MKLRKKFLDYTFQKWQPTALVDALTDEATSTSTIDIQILKILMTPSLA